MTTVADAVAQAKQAILDDIEAGVVPGSVMEFSKLHDYVDANMYVERAYEAGGVEAADDAIGQVDIWLGQGRIDHCPHSAMQHMGGPCERCINRAIKAVKGESE